MESLILSQNQLEYLNDSSLFSKTTQLKELDLGYNKLNYLDPNLFDGLIHLNELKLENNELTIVTPFVASLSRSLSTLYLNNNLLTNLNAQMFQQEMKNAEIKKKTWFYYDKKLTEPEYLNPFIENLMDPFKFKSSSCIQE